MPWSRQSWPMVFAPSSACRRMWTIWGSLNRLLRIESAPLTGRILPFGVVQFSGGRSSATVEITQDQEVIPTGPYAIVRNPMYSSAAVYFIGMSLALGSYWGLIPAILTILGLIWRLFDEEKFLAQKLPGYTDYCAKVRWHLIPGVF